MIFSQNLSTYLVRFAKLVLPFKFSISPSKLLPFQFIQEIWANAHKMRESLSQLRFSSLAENWGVHAKLIYRYQILYLDRITIVAWCHLVNDIDLCRSPKSPKKSIKPPSIALKVIEFRTSERQCTISY